MTSTPTTTLPLTAYDLAELSFALWEAGRLPSGRYTHRFDELRGRIVDARVKLFAAHPAIEEYDRRKLEIVRKRWSTTQGSVTLIYAGTELDVYGDRIQLKAGEWVGDEDEHWHEVARRVAGRRGLCG